jgi:glycosyltransferase involved in cell wall biosynthesis
MKILLITAYFPPDVGSAPHLFYDLGRGFVERGHQVTVVTGFPSYHAQGDLCRYEGRRRLTETMAGMQVARIRVPELARDTMIGRGLWQYACAAVFTAEAFGEPAADVSLVYSPPLPLGLSAMALRARHGIPMVINIQDLFPQSAIDLGVMKNRALIRGFEWLESFLYRKADGISVHSEGNRAHVLARGGRPGTTRVLENTVDTEQLHPGPRANALRAELNLGDRFVASFGGIMGLSQDLDVILGAAQRVQGASDMVFLLAGEGVEKPRLMQASAAMGLNNVVWLPMLPRERYPLLLEASDACLTTLHAEVKTPVVPSKILSAMAAGRPVVAAMDPAGDAPRLIARAQAGVSLPPEDPEALARALLDLSRNPEQCRTMGESGRRFAEEHLSTGSLVRAYETLFTEILAGGKRQAASGAERGESRA